MKLKDIEVGQKVRVRDWDDMAEEFGYDCCGEIETPSVFADEMRPLCGKQATILSVNQAIIELDFGDITEETDWIFDADMLEEE